MTLTKGKVAYSLYSMGETRPYLHSGESQTLRLIEDQALIPLRVPSFPLRETVNDRLTSRRPTTFYSTTPVRLLPRRVSQDGTWRVDGYRYQEDLRGGRKRFETVTQNINPVSQGSVLSSSIQREVCDVPVEPRAGRDPGSVS